MRIKRKQILIIFAGKSNTKSITLKTTLLETPGDPLYLAANWTDQRFRQPAYGEVGIENFDPYLEARHVAILQGFRTKLGIREFMVFGKLG